MAGSDDSPSMPMRPVSPERVEALELRLTLAEDRVREIGQELKLRSDDLVQSQRLIAKLRIHHEVLRLSVNKEIYAQRDSTLGQRAEGFLTVAREAATTCIERISYSDHPLAVASEWQVSMERKAKEMGAIY